jgi:2-polyprenyl-3-methyl-5-hydroxy-6-metoxy-1,4-benzoquinol methylase
VKTGSATPPAPPAPLVEDDIRPRRLRDAQRIAMTNDIARLQARRAEFVSVRCPACDGDDSMPAFGKYGFSYVRCRACRTIFMTPRPTPAIMKRYYEESENYRCWAEQIFPSSEMARRDRIHAPRLQRLIGACRTHGHAGGTLVEIGPGFGTFLGLAARCGFFHRVVGIEPNPDMASACGARGLEILQMQIESVTPSHIVANTVAAFEVIEHLFNPRTFLELCRTLLAPGGMLAISCPNGEGFDVALLGAQSPAIDPEHVNLFNPRSLERLVLSCGFDILEIATPGRLDAEIVREAALNGRIDLKSNALLQHLLIDAWDAMGASFQQFLAEHRLSSHMTLLAKKRN